MVTVMVRNMVMAMVNIMVMDTAMEYGFEAENKKRK